MSLRPSAKTEIRGSRYKVAVDTEEGRRRREDYLVEIRKNKREESLMKKRRDGAKDLPPDSDNPFENLLEISNMIAGVFSNDPSLQLESTTRFRMILSLNRNPPIDNAIQFGVVPRFVEFLKKDDHPKLQFEAAWALTNIAYGTSSVVKPAIPAFERLVHSNDEEVLRDACWALYNLSVGSNEKIQSVIEAGVVRRLVELIQHPSPVIFVPAIRIIGNIVAGNHQQTQCVINCGALPVLADLLTQKHVKGIKREACWMISNITAGTGDQIQSVIDANLIPTLVNKAQHAEFDIKKEAVWEISNATVGGSPNQIKYLVDQNCTKPLCDILVCPDLRIILVCLNGLEKILMAGEVEKTTGDVNSYSQMIEDAEPAEP